MKRSKIFLYFPKTEILDQFAKKIMLFQNRNSKTLQKEKSEFFSYSLETEISKISLYLPKTEISKNLSKNFL